VIARHVVVTGRVQGVGFRWSTFSEGTALGLTGWVRNRADGSVEAFVQGDEATVGEMLAWLGEGPFGATVGGCSVEEAEPDSSLSAFEIRP
jgi:acylphosphatase